jgi:hypothetical protein
VIGATYLIVWPFAWFVATVVAAKSWADEFEDGRATFEGAGWACLVGFLVALVWPLAIPALGVMKIVNILNEDRSKASVHSTGTDQ